MKRSVATICAASVMSLFLATALTVGELGKLEATGKVISIDPYGKSITISAKVGAKTMEVETIIDKNTLIKVKGSRATLRDIDVGDTVTVRYIKADDFYAKEVRKR